MPRFAAQLEADPQEQGLLLSAYVLGALVEAQPHDGFVTRLMRMAATHDELGQLDRIMAIGDARARGLQYDVLLGCMMSRIALDQIRRIGG